MLFPVLAGVREWMDAGVKGPAFVDGGENDYDDFGGITY